MPSLACSPRLKIVERPLRPRELLRATAFFAFQLLPMRPVRRVIAPSLSASYAFGAKAGGVDGMTVWLRGAVVGLVILAGACTPPETQSEAPQTAAASGDVATQAVIDVLTPIVAAEIGAPVLLQVTTANVTDEWAYVVALPRNGDGSAIDWATTNLASRYENGAMDESGAVYALLRRENGVWVIVERVTAPTDVAWTDWAARHNVPAGVVDVPAAP
jgi:hypothetical protein